MDRTDLRNRMTINNPLQVENQPGRKEKITERESEREGGRERGREGERERERETPSPSPSDRTVGPKRASRSTCRMLVVVRSVCLGGGLPPDTEARLLIARGGLLQKKKHEGILLILILNAFTDY